MRKPAIFAFGLALATLGTVAAASAVPGTYYVSGFATASADNRTDAVMTAHESAVANAERTCNNYANSYNGEDASISEVRTTNSSGNWIGQTYFANVSVSAKCRVTR